MVSGLVTSPCDQLRIFSGEARLMRIASKSAIGFARSKGLERNKVILGFLRKYAPAGGSRKQLFVPACSRAQQRVSVSTIFEILHCRDVVSYVPTGCLICCGQD